MYALYAPVQATYKGSQSLKGLVKMKYDKEHKESLAKYPELKACWRTPYQNSRSKTFSRFPANQHGRKPFTDQGTSGT